MLIGEQEKGTTSTAVQTKAYQIMETNPTFVGRGLAYRCDICSLGRDGRARRRPHRTPRVYELHRGETRAKRSRSCLARVFSINRLSTASEFDEFFGRKIGETVTKTATPRRPKALNAHTRSPTPKLSKEQSVRTNTTDRPKATDSGTSKDKHNTRHHSAPSTGDSYPV